MRYIIFAIIIVLAAIALSPAAIKAGQYLNAKWKILIKEDDKVE